MSIFLDKFLTALALPPGNLLVASLLGLALRRLGRPRTGGALIGIALLGGWLLATPVGAGWLMRPLEADFPAVPVAALPDADVIVVLGGGLAPLPDDGRLPDVRTAADRYWLGAALFHAGRAPVVVASGGNVWSGAGTEARAIRRLMSDLGVPEEAIVLEERSRTTYEHARYSALHPVVAEAERIILVTSASHMRRALGAFRRTTAASLIAASTDHTAPGTEPLSIRLLPDADALATSARALHEYLGLVVYRVRGWI